MVTSVFENLRLSISEIWTNKLRAFLTVLGITIGIAAVVLLLSLGQAVQVYLNTQFASLGANTITITAKADKNDRFDSLTEELAQKLSDPKRAPAVGLVMPQASSNYSVTYANNQFTVNVVGGTTDYLTAQNRTVSKGRFFSADEYQQSIQVAVIGSTTAENLFGVGDPIDQTIRVQTALVQVIGVFKTAGSNDDIVVMPLTTFKTRLKNSYTADGQAVINTIIVQAVDSTKVDTATTQLKTILREERGISEGETDNFTVSTAATIASTLNSIVQILIIFLAAVAGISLLVGGINIMNIMLVSITERTREIGLRKAVGAQFSDIVILFLIQAIVLTLIGGVVGVMIAWGASAIISAIVPDFSVIVQSTSIIFAVGISTVIGLFFGVYPASRAAQLNPIDALRYE
ncbi:MAG: FtsX-like permease family protein [Anaerolineaceae bacterium]|nr:FtsX-like permease family protein [Anaerolineaceae bacterium]